MGTAADARSFEFGGFRLDAAKRCLFGTDGAPIPLPSRAFDVLLFMVERPGDLLDKAAILKAVWPTTVVEESNLSQCVFALRKGLGDTASEHRFIATVPGRGYQFVAQVNASAPIGDTPPFPGDATPAAAGAMSGGNRRVWLIAGAALVLLASLGYLLWPRETAQPSSAAVSPLSDPTELLKTIAVLPFADLSPAQDMEYLADGLAEELMSSLTKVGRLKVVGRRSAFTFKGRNEDVRVIGAQLKVASILEGSVRKDGERLRISAQLSRTADGFSLWSETYDRKLVDVLDIQASIARDVVAALDPMGRAKKNQSERANLTRNPDAYAAYLRGLHLFRQEETDLPRSCNELKRAVTLDPQFAMAHARLARCYEFMAYRTAGNYEELKSLAHASVERALQLDPTLAELWWMHWFSERQNTLFVVTAARLERAVASDPDDAEAIFALGSVYRRLGRREDAYRMFERAYFADPLWPSSIYPLAQSSYSWKGDRQRFLDLIAQAERIAPDSPTPSDLLAQLAFIEGRALDWDRLVARQVELGPRELSMQGWLSLDYSNLGETKAALHHARMCQRINPRNAAGWYNVAHIHLFSGNVAAARPVVQEAMALFPSDFLALSARAELQYFTGDCAGSIESILLAQPWANQPPPALDVIWGVDWVPMLTYCQRKQGNATRAAELAQAFDIQIAPPTQPGEDDGLRARMAAAMGDRSALLTHLRALVKTKSMKFAFSVHEPMIQPYLNDPEIKPLLAALEARRAEWRRILPKASVRVPVPGIDAAQ